MRRTIAGLGLALALVASACGSDDSSSDPATPGDTSATDPGVTDSTAGDTTSPDGSSTSDGENTPEPTGGTLVMADISPVQTFDPALANTPQIGWLRPVYDTLIRRVGLSEYEGGLATDWSLDGMDLTLDLRSDVSFTDGTPFDAEAVKANLDRGKSSEGPLAPIYNAIDSVAVVDAETVTLTLAKPRPSILFDLSGVVGMMLSPAAFDAADLDRNPVGTGPWMFDGESSVEGDKAVYVKNPDYWAPDLQLVDTVEIRMLEDPTALLNAMSTGQVQAGGLQAAGIVAAEQAGLDLATAPVLSWGLFILDREGTLVPALADPLVRQAMAYAIDREAIVDSVLFGKGGLPGGSFFSEETPAFSQDAEDAYGLDLDQARELLADAGYPDGFSMDLPTIPPFQPMAEVVAGALAEIGIDVNLVPLQSDLTAELQTKNFPAAVILLPTESPFTVFGQVLAPGGPFNPFSPDEPEILALLQAAGATGTDAASQAGPFADVNAAISEQGIVITLAQGFRTVAFSTDVVGERLAISAPPDPRGLGVDG